MRRTSFRLASLLACALILGSPAQAQNARSVVMVLPVAESGISATEGLSLGAKGSEASRAMTPEAGILREWIERSGDNAGAPFVIIDKREARLMLFAPNAQLMASSAVLLGSAPGDRSAPGVGSKPLAQVRPEERTTPAGRFASEHGMNLRGEHVVWIDYDAAVSIHPVLTTNPSERREERLRASGAASKRISNGCVNVPTAFFHQQLHPTLARSERPIVYVLPDTEPMSAFFPSALDQPRFVGFKR